MERIVIKNFGPVKDAEIEIPKVLVLIGEQGTGKSTVAKLIYFFKSIRDEVFLHYFDGEQAGIDLGVFVRLVNDKFLRLFGSTRGMAAFEVAYHFAPSVFISVVNSSRGLLQTTFSPALRDAIIGDQLVRIRFEYLANLRQGRSQVDLRKRIHYDQQNQLLVDRFLGRLEEIFKSDHLPGAYCVAGRESTVSYPQTYSDFVDEREEEIKGRNKARIQWRQSVDETLLVGFIKHVRNLYETFKRLGGWQGILEEYSEFASKNGVTVQVLQRNIQNILKAEYSIEGQDEYLVVNGKRRVFLKDTSSGQKEAIRLLQDIFLSVITQEKIFRVIEEPEAHLFPSAQKNLTELLVLLANAQPSNQAIITTHSPYILSVLNILLLAADIAKTVPGAKERLDALVPEPIRLKTEDFRAYSLSDGMNPDEPACANLVNPETGMVSTNYLDGVSFELGFKVQELLNFYDEQPA